LEHLNWKGIRTRHHTEEVQMNELIDENAQGITAGGTSGIQPTWEAKETADAIDRIGGKDSPGATVFEEPGRLTV
jgi:hypothetical protein